MDELGYVYYQAANLLFEAGQYDKAVENFIRAYSLGVYKEEILTDLYACFVTPNEAEFRGNYEENRKGILDIPYDDLEVDFIPVSDTKYYLFHRPSKEFKGIFELDGPPALGLEAEFESVLIADSWDFREMLPVLSERAWQTVYILLSEQKECFASFLKLPHFREDYLGHVVVFDNADIMRLFFQEYPDFYLPRTIFAKNDRYQAMIEELHEYRVRDFSKNRGNVLLSILIPSYNRGEKALNAVREICNSYYDSEIEIIVSDNASTLGLEGYQAIRDMGDARVRYHRNERDVGYFENAMGLLDMAKGKFSVLSSDEDVMDISSLPFYLNLIYRNSDCGSFYMGGIGGNFGLKLLEFMRCQGWNAITDSINSNYVTGSAYNMDLLRKLELTDFIRQNKDNRMVYIYPHCVLNLRLSLMSDRTVCGQPPLWFAGEAEEVDGAASDDIKVYMEIDDREEQFVDSIKLFVKCGIGGSLLTFLYYERSWKFLYLLRLSAICYPSYYERNHIKWEDTLEDAIGRCKRNMWLLEGHISSEEKELLRQRLDELHQKGKAGNL